MRALTFWQPWASLVMTRTPEGGCLKPVENRKRPVPSTLPQWMTCLGCYAEAEPDEVAADPECPRPCACDNGYTVEPGAGILDSRHVRDWVPSADVGSPTHVGRFPFRLWIHAGSQWDAHARPPICFRRVDDLEPCHRPEMSEYHDPLGPLGCHVYDPYPPLREDLVYGALLGSVLVTGCHWADECADFDAVTLGQCVDIDGGWWHKPTDAKPCHTVKYCSPWAEADCYHIEVTDPQPLPEPIQMRGYQGWWTLPDDIAAEVAR